MEGAIELLGSPKLVVADGAGTLFDPGSVIPLYGFTGAFDAVGLAVSEAEVRQYMGMKKPEHIKQLLQDAEAKQEGILAETFPGKTPDQAADAVYEEFKPALYRAAALTDEIPGVEEAVAQLYDSRISVVMTTGYDREMVNEIGKKLPWVADLVSFTSSDVEHGRPRPDMIRRSMGYVGLQNPTYGVKVGDTAVDLEAADNAGMPSVLVTTGNIAAEDAESVNEAIGRRHLVLDSFTDLADLILEGELRARISTLNR